MTEAIIPRWEWRMFAERFGDAERRLASLATAPPQLSDEQYQVRDVLGCVSDDRDLTAPYPTIEAAIAALDGAKAI